MDTNELRKVLDEHMKSLRGIGGELADLYRVDLSHRSLCNTDLSKAHLSEANLSGANLSGANLSGANLYGANLYGANLYGADLSKAKLFKANLSRANLSKANLSCAVLSEASLLRATLSKANLYGATLSEANLYGAVLCGAKDIATLVSARLFVPPPTGAFEAWKKCACNVLVKLSIPAEARRSSATTRKCRAEFVDVLEVIGGRVAYSMWDTTVRYCPGQRVHCHKWEEDRWVECGGGIHFYMSRTEAEAH